MKNKAISKRKRCRGRLAGLGTSKIGGLPNNKHCTLCNLYPLSQHGKVREKTRRHYYSDEWEGYGGYQEGYGGYGDEWEEYGYEEYPDQEEIRIMVDEFMNEKKAEREEEEKK